MGIPQHNKLLSSAMAAKILGFTPDYIRKLCLDGTIKAERLGHDWIITEKAIKNIKRKRFPKKQDTKDSKEL